MAGQVNTYGLNGSTVFGLAPGASQGWIMWGTPAEYGRAVSVVAQPLGGPPEERVVEVLDLAYEVGSDGNRRLFFTVRNNAQSDADYQIFVTYTDTI
jgi:hypothetical protein